jgi:hypothetical protein
VTVSKYGYTKLNTKCGETEFTAHLQNRH